MLGDLLHSIPSSLQSTESVDKNTVAYLFFRLSLEHGNNLEVVGSGRLGKLPLTNASDNINGLNVVYMHSKLHKNKK